jgi:fatty acid desaturase
MPVIPLNSDTTEDTVDSRAERAERLEALSGLFIVAGTLLVTIAALIKWWPVSPVLLVVGAALFWTFVAVTAKDEPNETPLVASLRDA